MIFKKNKSAEKADTILGRPLWLKTVGWLLVAVFLFLTVVGWYWSRMPDVFWVNQKVNGEKTVIGYATTDTLIRVAETLLDKPGGYLSNDVMLPGVFLDNIPNWEFGVLQQVRDMARVIRNDYSRSQSQSKEDVDVVVGEPKFFFDNDSWILPRTESQYRDAIAGFVKYRNRLAGVSEPQAQFYARADNLREWLAQVEKRLGSLSRRLGDSVYVRTSWFEIDDIFYEARGTAWALVHFFRAAEFDFAQVLADKTARASVRQIIREFEASLKPMTSPIVLNGGGFGLFANHSLVMANYIDRATSVVIILRKLLDKW